MTLARAFRRLVRQTEGVDLVEYALLGSFVAITAYAGVTSLGNSLSGLYTAVFDSVIVQSEASGAPDGGAGGAGAGGGGTGGGGTGGGGTGGAVRVGAVLEAAATATAGAATETAVGTAAEMEVVTAEGRMASRRADPALLRARH